MLSAVVLAFWSSAHVDAQTIPWPREDRLTTTVRASATLLGGDTVRVIHAVHNNRSSLQRLDLFAVVTRSTFTATYTGPTTNPYWYTSTGNLQDTAAISWSPTDPSSTVAPGDSAVGFSHTAVGDLDIVAYHVQGYVEPPYYDESKEDNIGAPPSIWKGSFKGSTIAVVPFPADMSPAGMAQRFAAVAKRACERRFVKDASLCVSNPARLQLVLRAVEAKDLLTACSQFGQLITYVSGLRGSLITPEGKALLTIRAQQFRNHHCKDGN